MKKKFRTLIVEKNVRSNKIWIKDAVWAFHECLLKIIRIKFWKFFIRYFFENEICFAGVGGGGGLFWLEKTLVLPDISYALALIRA